MANSTKSTATTKSTKTLKSAKSKKSDINVADGFGNSKTRLRSDFSCYESQVQFKQKLAIATQLRARGSRYTAQFLARHRTLSDLQMMLVTFWFLLELL